MQTNQAAVGKCKTGLMILVMLSSHPTCQQLLLQKRAERIVCVLICSIIRRMLTLQQTARHHLAPATSRPQPIAEVAAHEGEQGEDDLGSELGEAEAWLGDQSLISEGDEEEHEGSASAGLSRSTSSSALRGNPLVLRSLDVSSVSSILEDSEEEEEEEDEVDVGAQVAVAEEEGEDDMFPLRPVSSSTPERPMTPPSLSPAQTSTPNMAFGRPAGAMRGSSGSKNRARSLHFERPNSSTPITKRSVSFGATGREVGRCWPAQRVCHAQPNLTNLPYFPPFASSASARRLATDAQTPDVPSSLGSAFLSPHTQSQVTCMEAA
jgi:hypothetical protein